MTDAKITVWQMLRDIIALCWRERATALKFGLVPVAVNIVLVVFFTELAPDSFIAYARSWAISLVSILAFAPFCVAWYRMILFGPDAVATRPFFTITLLELKFFGWMLMISLMAALVGIIMTIVGVTIVIILAMISDVLAWVGGMVIAVAALFTILMFLSRWSIGLAMVASGQPMNINHVWESSKPFGWRMATIQMIFFLATATLAGAAMAIALPDFLTAIRTKTAASETSQIIVQLVGTMAGAVALWLTTTMYALVYQAVGPQHTTDTSSPSEQAV